MAYQLRQGYVRHGEGQDRKTTPALFAHKLNQYIDRFQPISFGTISVQPNALYQYGHLLRIQLDEKKALWTFVYEQAQTNEQARVTVPFLGITLTHDVEFTIEDEQKGIVTYPVFYLTAKEKPRGPSVTYYIGAENLVSQPLDCIADFYLRSYEFGKDIRLSKRSCTK